MMSVIEYIIEAILLPMMVYVFITLWNWNKAAKKIQELAEKYMEQIGDDEW